MWICPNLKLIAPQAHSRPFIIFEIENGKRIRLKKENVFMPTVWHAVSMIRNSRSHKQHSQHWIRNCCCLLL